MKRILIPFILLCVSIASLHAEALDYLNALRKKAELVPFIEETHLQRAAQNHSDYMQTNHTSGHYEDSSKPGFTGKTPLDRVQYAGYSSSSVSENVSWSTHGTYKLSIDSLFSAIYHRYGFLDMDADEIGIGISQNGNFYTYDMGFRGNHKDESPDIVIWPPENSTDIPPVFYEESPDPLPDISVSGYPVSVEFNRGTYKTPPTVSELNIKDVSSGKTLDRIVLMKKDNDPHNRLSAYQAVNFPKKRLEWGHVYQAELTYSYENNPHTKIWYFKTRTLKVDKFYRIKSGEEASRKVLSGKTYGIYVVPKDENDYFQSMNYQYTAKNTTVKMIDFNTISVKLEGEKGNSITLKFSNGQNITLTIDDKDTAVAPVNVPLPEDEDDTEQNNETDTDHDGIPDVNDIDDDNDGMLDTIEKLNGLDPLNPSDAQTDLDGDGFSNSIELDLGTDIRSPASHPIWVPVLMGEIITFVPSV